MSGTAYEWGEWRFEPTEWRLTRNGVVVALPAKTLDLLALLLGRAPTLVTKDEILRVVWPDATVEEGNIAFHVNALRRTLDENDGPSCIETVRARGYRFVAELAPATIAAPPLEAPAAPVEPVEQTEPEPERAEAPSAVEVTAASRRFPRWALGVVVIAIVALAWSNWPPDTAIRSVVVMPFDASGIDPDKELLTTRLADAVSTRGGTLAALRMIAPGPRREGEGTRETGVRLGADAVLTGKVEASANRLLVSVQLIRAYDGLRVWNWAFEVPDGDRKAVQAEIAERTAVGLSRRLATGRRVPAGSSMSDQASALFVQANERWRLRTPHSVQQAITLYEQAIALDPSFARAYAGLADCYNIAMSGLSAEARYPLAKANAEKAIALAPDLGDGHRSLAFLHYKFEWRWKDSDLEFQQAIALNPRDALAHHWYGEFLSTVGKYEAGVASLKRALDLEPQAMAIRSDMVPPLLRLGRIADARAAIEDAMKIDPDWYWLPMRMADILAAEGKERESVESRRRSLILIGTPLQSVDELRDAYTAGGLRAMIAAEIRQYLAIEAATPGAPRNATNLSLAYGRLGNRAEALRWLTTAIDRREDAVVHMPSNPAYDSIRNEPEFGRLMTRVGLTAYLAAGEIPGVIKPR